MVRQRARIRFRKQGDLRLIGHRDLVRCVERLFHRAGLKLAVSQGFHPKPRMSFPSALALGIEGLEEVMEMELTESHTPEGLLEQLQPHAQPGLVFDSIQFLPPGTPKAQVQSLTYEVSIPPGRRSDVSDRVARLMASSCCPVQRPNKPVPIDVRPFLQELTLLDGVLRMRLRVGRQGSAGPRDVLRALGQAELEREGAHLRRTGVELQR